MSNQSDHTNSDPRVSDAYRAIADEQTPDHLDETVMRMAAKASRTRYSAARAWMRPAAWAATIGLSLAIVLQLTQLPQESLQYDAAPADMATTDLDQPEVVQPAEMQEAVTITEPIPAKAPLVEEWRAREMPAKATAAPVLLDDEVRSDVAADVAQSETAAEAAPLRSMSLRAKQQMVAPQSLCPADVRDSAGRWYDCIESQRETMPESRIAAELEELFAAYPEFVVPVENR